jgi:hypothetical protein
MKEALPQTDKRQKQRDLQRINQVIDELYGRQVQAENDCG